MGKGKGKAESWSINISPGTVLFEVETFNYNKVVHLLTKLLTKLPFKAYLVKFTKKFIFF
jgi:ribosomal protein L16/L10AE